MPRSSARMKMMFGFCAGVWAASVAPARALRNSLLRIDFHSRDKPTPGDENPGSEDRSVLLHSSQFIAAREEFLARTWRAAVRQMPAVSSLRVEIEAGRKQA